MKRVILAFCVALLGAAPAVPQTAALRDFQRANQHRWLKEFADFLALPNVASDRENIRRNAAHLMELMRQRGLEPRLLEAKNANAPPVVFAEWRTPGAQKTLVFYAHYDGQPVNPAAWTASPPFTPTLRADAHARGGAVINFPAPGESINPDWRLYARGASDDKAGVVAILNAFAALRATNTPPSVNVKFFFEGEEEAGSPHLAEILAAHKDLLKSDGWVICDGPVHQSGRKQVVFGVRGDTNVDVTTYGPKRPLHSGHYGNWAPNPAMILARLLASMKDADGRVAVKDWYADAEPLGPAERQALREVPDFDQALRDELGLARTEGAGQSLNELIAQPSLNINGLSSADVGPLARNVIPTTATATLDLRLVKGNDYRRQVEKLRAHIRLQGFYVMDRDPTDEERRRHPLIAKVVHRSGGYNAQRTRLDLPLGRAIVAAVQSVSAEKVVEMPTLGGSLPLSIITESLGTDAITVPIANYDNNQHAENENIRLGHLWDGIEIYAALMTMKL
jgi:acetylornithine deacetylase/succinyl-diaminopimelate desuccinylase-like protein